MMNLEFSERKIIANVLKYCDDLNVDYPKEVKKTENLTELISKSDKLEDHKIFKALMDLFVAESNVFLSVFNETEDVLKKTQLTNDYRVFMFNEKRIKDNIKALVKSNGDPVKAIEFGYRTHFQSALN